MKRRLQQGWLEPLIRALTPQQCALCRLDAPAANPGSDLCAGCAASLAPIARCPGCALAQPITPGNPTDTIQACGICRQKPPPWDQACAGFDYRHPGDLLVLAFKRERQLWAGRSLAHCMAQGMGEDWPAQGMQIDLLVAIPAHTASLVRRGFNPAAELAKRLARRFDLPFAGRALNWTTTGERQTLLNASSRAAALHGRLRAHAPTVRNQRVAVIDDVMTTGATLHEATRALRAAGANRVVVWVAARTPPPDDAAATTLGPPLIAHAAARHDAPSIFRQE